MIVFFALTIGMFLHSSARPRVRVQRLLTAIHNIREQKFELSRHPGPHQSRRSARVTGPQAAFKPQRLG